jgi:pimeloyl-ACP methyl ester carboxylesterase
MTPSYALSAGGFALYGRAGRLWCYDDGYYDEGEGAPLLLLHSINAAASAWEIKPIFDAFHSERRVFAPDLPGYGRSERSDRHYDTPLFTGAIDELLEQIADRTGGAPVDALAVSLSCEFLARCAARAPERFRTLAFVTPTGFQRGADRLRSAEHSTREFAGLHRLLTASLWRRPLFDLLASRASIRYFLKRSYGSDAIDESLVDAAWATTREPGAEYAPYAFLSGRLFSADIRNVYESLRLPVFMTQATRGDFRDFSEAGWTAARDNWQVLRIDGGALPHFEQPQRFAAAYRAFLAGHG